MMKRRLHTILLILGILVTGLSTNSAQSTLYTNPISCGTDIPIRDNSCPEDLPVGDPDEFRVSVSGAPGNQLGVDIYLKEVRILISHSWIGDLDINLISPSGQTVLLMADLGGGDDNLGDVDAFNCSGYVTFSVSSCSPIENDFPPFLNGPYSPMEDLLNFNDGSTNPNGEWILQICDDVIEDGGTLQYFELVFEPIACLPVQNPQIINVDTTTAVIEWLPIENCGPIVIEYGPPGFIPGNSFNAGEGLAIEVNECAPYFLSNLDPDSDYDIYLRSFCSSTNSFSENTCPLFIQTGCAPPPLSLSTDFDDQIDCGNTCGTSCDISGVWRNDIENDDFDWLVNEGETPTFGTGPSTDISGDGKYIYIEASGSTNCPEGTKAYLVSNCIQFNKAGTDTCHLSFNYHMFGFAAGSLSLEVSNDGGFSWETIWMLSGNQGEDWNKIYLSLAQFEDGANLQFRFVATKGSGSKGDIAIDEINFYGSVDNGLPNAQFFRDADMDGFGDPAQSLFSCASDIPAGFVANDLDCDDTNPNINPNALEIACNGIDENCNGILDDTQLASPVGENDTICSGEQAEVCVTPGNLANFILWYGSPSGNDLLGPPSTCLNPIIPANNSSSALEYTFYAAEVGIGCGSVERTEVKVVVFPNPDLKLESEPAVCPDQELNLASLIINDLNFTGGNLLFSDQFPVLPEEALDDLVITPSEIGTVYYQMTTDRGCSDTDSFNIQRISGPALSFFPAQNLGLCNESDQIVRVEASGGNGPYTYLWGNGVQNDSVMIMAPANINETDQLSVRVTDQDGCFTEDTITYTNTNGLIGVQRSVSAVSECGLEDGQIELRPLSGTAPFAYQWSGTSGITGDSLVNSETFILDSLAQSAYDITISDASSEGCEFVLRSVLVNGPAAVLAPPDITPVSCRGATDGEICLEPQLGSTPSFLWNTGDTTSCVSGLAGGSYSVTVTEGDCQTVIEEIIIPEPDPIRLVFENTASSCGDTPDGRIDLTVFGGIGPYTFAWSNGSTEEDLTNVLPGLFEVTVTDANGCEAIEFVFLNSPEPIQLFRDSLRNISCFGETDGFIRISTVGGLGPYQYEWSNGIQSPIATDLPKGNYTISVTDFKGCQATLDFVISEPDQLEATVLDVQQPVCLGDATGQITLDVNGGTAPYSYEWSNGASGAVAQNLPVGKYEVVIKDARACFTDTLRIDLQPSSTINLNAIPLPPTCFGRTDGSIVLNPDGNEPFQFEWSNGATTSSISNLASGAYTLTLQDGDGCQLDTTFILEGPAVFTAEQDVRNPSCAGESDALISINVNGNFQEPFSYQWNDGPQTRNRVGIGPGIYQLTITDNRNCQFITDTILVESPDVLVANILETGSISCKGDTTGFIELETLGGTAPYRYEWSNNEMTQGIFNIPAGNYSVQVRDANNCLVETSVQLVEPEELVPTIDITLGEVCSGDAENLLESKVIGGVGPYQYRWSNDSTSQNIRNVGPGDYLVSVIDANQCLEVSPSVKVKDVSNKLTLDTFFVQNISCNGESDGKMTAIVSGGRAPYQFHFSNNHIVNTEQDSVTCEDLPIDRDYQVTITDRNGCVVISQVESITQPGLLAVVINTVEPISCSGEQDGNIMITAAGGNEPYAFSWANSEGQIIGNTEDLLNVPSGTYSLSISDSKGCTNFITGIQVLEEVNPIILVDSLTFLKDISCKGGSDGIIEVAIIGGTPPYNYNWSSGANFRALRNVPAGTYDLSVTDENGCIDTFPGFLLTEPATQLEPDLFLKDASCFGSNTGSATIRVTGGEMPYSYLWLKDGVSIQVGRDTIQNIDAGNYMVLVEDNNQCLKEVDFQIGQPDELLVDIEFIANIVTDTIDRLSAIVSGGVPDYTYLWNTGAMTASIPYDGVQDYSVRVIDANNCIVVDTVFLTAVVDRQQVNAVKIYPNPSQIKSFVDIELNEALELELEVINLIGQRIANRRSLNAIEHRFEINTSQWPSGMYLIRLKANNRVIYVDRLIVGR